MKKKTLVGLAVILVLLLLFPLSNLVIALPETALAKLQPADPDAKAAVAVLSAKCGSCHTPDPGLPWYAGLPVASGLVKADVEAGVRAMDFLAALTTPDGGPVPEVALAKTEHAIATGAMPPGRFLMLHWNMGVGDDDAATLLAWVRKERVANYATGTAAAERESFVLQPLPREVPHDAKKAALGREMFHDGRLSGDGTVSCASCHGLDKGGCDQAAVATGVGGAKGPINSPTVYNSGYQFRQFWDGRAADLPEQAAGPVENPIEMAAKWPDVVAKLREDTDLAARFGELYPEGITKDTVTDAIAEFERTLVTPGAFDLYLEGDATALTDEQKKGLDLFVGKGCATCHAGKILGGGSYELMGRKGDYFGDRGNPTDADQGRFNVTKEEKDRHCFKVPTLRNVALTFPYFHDARTSDLAVAVRHMADYQLGVDLTDEEAAAIVAFLGSLTGEYEGELLK